MTIVFESFISHSDISTSEMSLNLFFFLYVRLYKLLGKPGRITYNRLKLMFVDKFGWSWCKYLKTVVYLACCLSSSVRCVVF